MVNQKHDSQAEKFVQAARKAESDESDDALDRIVGKLNLTKMPELEREKPYGK
jgi:hypothetical protein